MALNKPKVWWQNREKGWVKLYEFEVPGILAALRAAS